MNKIVSVSKYGRKYDEWLQLVEEYKKDVPYEFHDWIDSYIGHYNENYWLYETDKISDVLDAALNRDIIKMLEEYSFWKFFQPFFTLEEYKDRVPCSQYQDRYNYYKRERQSREILLGFRELMDSLYRFGRLD